MKSIELLEAFGDVKNAYIVSAEEFKQGMRQPQGKRLSGKRVWLIAAIFAIMLLFVGCTVAYFIRIQDMKVGEYSFCPPTEYDENGDIIPFETQEPIIQFSLQGGSNMEALKEWTAFTNTYDQDSAIAIESDRTGSAWDLPANYHLTYGCYSQEMVDRLDEITAKYNLKLLSEYVPLNWWEIQVLMDSLNIDSLFYDDTGVEYLDGDLHPEGTFSVSILLNLDMGDWTLEDNLVSYRYSLKEYFDPTTGNMRESQDYQQWNYTRKDGKTVLLVLGEGTARIFADLPDAFISISMDPTIRADGQETAMTRAHLQQIAELFDLDVKPQPTTMETVEKYKAQALAEYEAQQKARRANAQAELEAQYLKGYEAFAKYALEQMHNSPEASYTLFDVNGDGVQELIINGYQILSMKNGQSYHYFDLMQTGVIPPRFRPCENNIFEVWSEEDFCTEHLFYQAGAESASFITGVSYDSNKKCWYQFLTPREDGQIKQITEAEAQTIINSYTRIDFDWLPLKRYGEPILSITYQDPYARYIARTMERYDDADTFEYTLMDVTGDGNDELITRELGYTAAGKSFYVLYIRTIRDGELWDMDMDGFSYVCEGGVLEQAGDTYGREDTFWAFYRCTENGAEYIEKIVRDPATLYWGHAVAGQEGKTVTEETAMAVRNSYKRIRLDMKPFAAYPMR